MEKIKHCYLKVNGLNLHVAEIGSESAPAVVFLHGFPEIWYTWRHQMVAVSESGFRSIAPDYRGYGLSEPPPEPEKATFSDFISDLLALLDALDLSKVVLIAKDFGSRIAYIFALLHPRRVSRIVTLGVPFSPPNRSAVHKPLPEGCYITKFQERGRAEADFSRFDTKTIVRKIYILFSQNKVPTALKNQEIMDIVDSSTPLPSWLSEKDLSVYASLYEKSGFKTALQVPYRSLREEFDVANMKIEVPTLVITGGKDFSLDFPGVEDYIASGRFKDYVPNCEMVYLQEGSHFVHEQFPDQVSHLILNFIRCYIDQ